MQEDFHYYGTYCAAYLAGYSHEESLAVAYSAQMVDLCSATFLKELDAPESAATTQMQMEMMNVNTDPIGLQLITRIWASFHFLPYDLSASVRGSARYRQKYRLICKPNGTLVEETVNLAKDKGYEAAGLAMHVLADTWAHQNFAGTPSLVINNINDYCFELMEDGSERKVNFRHSVSVPDDLKKGLYTNTVYYAGENTVMNLGHGRAGHLPDYSFMRYRYLPAWDGYNECIKDNPSDYWQAFCQMIKALQYLHGDAEVFEKDTYANETAEPYREEIMAFLQKRQKNACEDWKAFGEKLSGREIPPFSIHTHVDEYVGATDKDSTYLGRFFLAAMAQKSLVTNRIFTSGSLLAGFSIDYHKKGFQGIRDYAVLVKKYLEAVVKK